MLVGEYLKNIGEVTVKNLVSATNDYMHVYQLLKEGRHQEAKYILEGYLIEKAKDGEELKGTLNETPEVPKSTAEELGKTIDKQVENIVDCLKQ